MWMLLPMISLMIRAIIGNSEIDDSTLSDIIRLGNGRNDIVIDNHYGKSLIDKWKIWKEELLKQEKGRRQTVGSGFDLSTTNKVFPKDFQQNKNPWLCWLKEKKLIVCPNEPNISCSCKMKRVRFEMEADKEGKKGYSCDRSNTDLQTKRTILAYDRYNRGTSTDGINGIKGVVEIEKIIRRAPFDHWRGKKAEKLIDREEEFLLLPKNPNNVHVLDDVKDEFPARRHTGKIDDEKHRVQMKNGISTMYENWNDNHNPFVYPIPFRVYNKTNEDDYMTEEGIIDINDWLTSMPEKKTKQHGQYKKTKFNPWGGKRNLKTYTFRFGNEYFTTPAYAVNSRKRFFPVDEQE